MYSLKRSKSVCDIPEQMTTMQMEQMMDSVEVASVHSNGRRNNNSGSREEKFGQFVMNIAF
jgi:hypothetical protein